MLSKGVTLTVQAIDPKGGPPVIWSIQSNKGMDYRVFPVGPIDGGWDETRAGKLYTGWLLPSQLRDMEFVACLKIGSGDNWTPIPGGSVTWEWKFGSIYWLREGHPCDGAGDSKWRLGDSIGDDWDTSRGVIRLGCRPDGMDISYGCQWDINIDNTTPDE
jgi:hypothetical protein